MEIAVIVTDQQKTHEGVVRPLVNLAKSLQHKHSFSFLLLNCSSEFSALLNSKVHNVITCGNKSALIQEATRIKPQLILTDDELTRLGLAQEVKKVTASKTAVYVQILYGSHSIANCFDLSVLPLKKKLVFKPLKYLPFSLFSGKYSKLLKDSDLVIANSKITVTFLQSIYNVDVSGVVYPPVDTQTFHSSSQKNSREITLYLGSHLGDVQQAFTQKILDAINVMDVSVNLFGNSKIANVLTKKLNSKIKYRSGLTDEDLAHMYSRSKITVCPQKWEQFGYVPVESMACGTPVLAFNCMGFQETIDETTGWLANSEAEFLKLLADALKIDYHPALQTRTKVLQNFSLDVSSKSFEGLLEKFFS